MEIRAYERGLVGKVKGCRGVLVWIDEHTNILFNTGPKSAHESASDRIHQIALKFEPLK